MRLIISGLKMSESLTFCRSHEGVGNIEAQGQLPLIHVPDGEGELP